jgi:hypothetical protein
VQREQRYRSFPNHVHKPHLFLNEWKVTAVLEITCSELGKAAWIRSAPSRGGVIQSSRPAITKVGTVISLRRGNTLNDGIPAAKA